MPPLTLLAGFSFLICGCSYLPSSSDCTQYRKGTFYYHLQYKGRESHYTMARTDSMQTETNEDNGNVAQYRIHWIDAFMSDDFDAAYNAIIKTFRLRENEVKDAISIPNTFLAKLAEYDKKAVNLPKKELPPPAMPN